jgi:60 kDa SS-A/Ro ribonucleoprotein
MMIDKLLAHFRRDKTPQTEPIPGTTQVQNSAGGFSWAVDDWTRLDRFLILGSEGNTYYATERAMTRENAECVLRCIQLDGVKTVARIVAISKTGRAPKNDPAIFALAMALKLGDLDTRRAARAAVPQVCRIGTHLFSLAEGVKAFGGWGRITQGAFSDWYTEKDPSRLAYQAVKYGSRNGWSGRDILRKAHVTPPTADHDAIFRWMTQGWQGEVPDTVPDSPLATLVAFEQAKRAQDPDTIVRLITEHGLVREAIPTRFLNEKAVWEALLDNQGRGMPITALLRNLAKMTSIGVLAPMTPAVRTVTGRLANREVLRKGRVHPLAVLNALTTYRRGRGVRGKLTWRPVPQVIDALDQAFYAAFDAIEPTQKRWMLGLDVSGSMGCGQLAGMPALTPRLGAAAMAMVTARTESDYVVRAFTGKLQKLDITPRQRLDDVLKATSSLPFGSTDCALPMVDAKKHRIPIDVFVVYTDSETWFGKVHPAQALKDYRQTMGIDAKLVVVGMVANRFTIADPDDPGMLDIVGFDTAAPTILRDFASA